MWNKTSYPPQNLDVDQNQDSITNCFIEQLMMCHRGTPEKMMNLTS